jgi:hypothetical protein
VASWLSSLAREPSKRHRRQLFVFETSSAAQPEVQRPYRPARGFAKKLATFFASIRINPRGHRGRVGPRIIGDDKTFPLRQLLGVQQLCWTYRFGVELTGRFTVGLFRRVFAKD